MYSVVMMIAMTGSPQAPDCIFGRHRRSPAPVYVPAPCPLVTVPAEVKAELKMSPEVKAQIEGDPKMVEWLEKQQTVAEKQAYVDDVQKELDNLASTGKDEVKKKHEEAVKQIKISEKVSKFLAARPDVKAEWEKLVTVESLKEYHAEIEDNAKDEK